MSSQKNVDFSEPSASRKTKTFSSANLSHLKTSNTKADMRGRGKKRTRTMYRLLSCVQYSSSSCLILCCCKAKDISGILQQFMELHSYE